MIKSNILNPADEARDFIEGEKFDLNWFDAVADKPELSRDLGWLREQVDREADDVALELTLRWQQTEPPRIKKPLKGETKRANGRVLRALRRRTHGLLLIYPVLPPIEVPEKKTEGRPAVPTGLSADGDPVIGVALSFPTSDTVLGVEYRVNKVWDAELREDAEYDD